MPWWVWLGAILAGAVIILAVSLEMASRAQKKLDEMNKGRGDSLCSNGEVKRESEK